MNALAPPPSGFPPNPGAGQSYGNWVFDGCRWVCTASVGVRVVTQIFRASAPYTPSPGLVTAVAETYGGGGGGGAAGPAGGTFNVLAGGGGASGGYSRSTLAAALVLGGVNVTIGQGGAFGVAAAAGQSGGATSFGAMVVANGGGGGQSNNGSTTFGNGGIPAAPGVGDWAMPGAGGFAGALASIDVAEAQAAQGGMGGSILGGAASGFMLGGVGIPGTAGAPNTGAGGSGGVESDATPGSAQVGGAGGSGICIVTEYCWSDATDSGSACCPPGGARVANYGWQGGFDND
jgi:hypothetical protein